MPPPKNDEEYVTFLAVAPDMQKKGIGRALINHQADIARQKKCRILSLDVSANNPKAEVFYERLGFEFITEYEWHLKAQYDVPNQRRFELIL